MNVVKKYIVNTLLGNTVPCHRLFVLLFAMTVIACNGEREDEAKAKTKTNPAGSSPLIFLNEPLIKSTFTADPSAHVFGDKIYIYPSHDVESHAVEDDTGGHFNMEDYHVYSMESPDAEVIDHGKVLGVADVPWAKRQMWAPDAAERAGKYYLYFPAKDTADIFRIGVAVSTSPTGPFKPMDEPIPGSFSIDPAVYKDNASDYYMYWGGIWGGQLQKWRTGVYHSTSDSPYADEPAGHEPAISPKVAKLSEDMTTFSETPRDVVILGADGEPIKAGDHERRFFEAAWMHKHEGTYYFSYSTGDTHKIVYATGDSPYGPFTYKGVLLAPVQGWTNHHSIVKVRNQWYLFYHDTQLSGKTHLRNIKMTPLEHLDNGDIATIYPVSHSIN